MISDARIKVWAAGVCVVVLATGCDPKENKKDPHAGHGGVKVVSPVRSPGGPAPFGYEKVDPSLVIGTLRGLMRYDVERFDVKPGAKVKLVLRNTDEMPHNLLICKPGTDTMQVAAAALALADKALDKHFVPESPLVLYHTLLVNPTESDTLYFTAPAEEGEYPYVCTFPGHALTMKGVMRVTKGATRGDLSDVAYKYYEGQWAKLPEFEKLQPIVAGQLGDGLMDISVAEHPDDFGLVFTGILNVPAHGKYTFFLDSDDGSRLSVDGKRVVDHDGLHSAGPEKSGEAILTPGEHAIVVEYFERGADNVLKAAWSGPSVARRPLTKDAATAPRPPAQAKFVLKVTGAPRFVRCVMPDSSPRSVAVGLPGGMNYCFDAEGCFVRYGWSGEFLDVGPDRGEGTNRGGSPNQPLGKRFGVGAVGFPLRLGAEAQPPAVRFDGYREGSSGQFFFAVDNLHVVQTITKATGGVGLTYTFELSAPQTEPVRFIVKPEGLTLTSSAGKWEGGTLTVPAAEAQKFSVTLLEKNNAER